MKFGFDFKKTEGLIKLFNLRKENKVEVIRGY